MLEALLGGIIGGVFRLAPELLKLVNGLADRRHELAVLTLQVERDQAARADRLTEIGAQAEAAFDQKALSALLEGVRGQGRLTGVAWIDAVSQTVRPFLTYWWMALYSVFKAAVFLQLWASQGDWKDAVTYVWTASDMGVLSAVINFWFLDRVIRLRK
jgi:hypothetical protein